MNISEYHTVELNPRGSYVTRGCHGTWAMKYDHSFLDHKRFGPGFIMLSISISLRRNSICSCYGSKSILFVNRGNMHSMQCNEWKKPPSAVFHCEFILLSLSLSMRYLIDLESESGTSKDTLWLGTRIKSTFVLGWMWYQIRVKCNFGSKTNKT